MIARINALPTAQFPKDGGLDAGMVVGPFDFVAEGGDIANRSEVTGSTAIQSAAASWSQFRSDYIDGLTLSDQSGGKAPLYIVPGNHEASNAVGFYKTMRPTTDKTAMIEIFNRMMAPAIRKTTATYDYSGDPVFYSRDIGGIHFVFIRVWPDSAARAWMDRDLQRVSASTPVIMFTHDQPDVEAKHFTNPNGAHDVNARDRFENLLVDRFADDPTIKASSLIEQGQLEDFLKGHANVTAYFHGNSNWHEGYDWMGPTHSIALHTFRVDSPMKGVMSSGDETKLSFQVATIETASQTMTVRECLWNPDARPSTTRIVWGHTTTVALRPSKTTPRHITSH